MTIYLLRVGIDGTNGEFWSKVYPDLSYTFIHVPEDGDDFDEKKPHIYYKDMRWNQTYLKNCVPERLLEVPVHVDPEFITYTYGTGNSHPSFSILSKIQIGDFFVFYAAFDNPNLKLAEDLDGYYIFSFFEVEKIYLYDISPNKQSEMGEIIRNNHHYLQGWGKKGEEQLIITGNPKTSTLFQKLVPLSLWKNDLKGTNYYPSEKISELLGGYNKPLNKSSCRSFDSPAVCRNFLRYLKQINGGSLTSTISPIHEIPK